MPDEPDREEPEIHVLPDDASPGEGMRMALELGAKRAKVKRFRPMPGVHKYRSIEEANADRNDRDD